MKKMPCLFRRTFHGHDSATLLREVTPGCEWVLAGEGIASRKWDGTACMVKDGVLYKRYDRDYPAHSSTPIPPRGPTLPVASRHSPGIGVASPA